MSNSLLNIPSTLSSTAAVQSQSFVRVPLDNTRSVILPGPASRGSPPSPLIPLSQLSPPRQTFVLANQTVAPPRTPIFGARSIILAPQLTMTPTPTGRLKPLVSRTLPPPTYIGLIDAPLTTKRDPTDSEIYDAATQPINIFAGNQPRWSIYTNPKTIEPTKIEFFGFDAYRIYDTQNPNRLFSVATDDGMNKTITKQFKIAFTRWGWKNTGPFVLICHGVPANQSQWWDIARLLAMVGFRVVTFDMLTMGWSTKPLFDNKEKIEKLRWVHDKHYVNWLADAIFGVGSKFVFIADDWGTGILHKYMEDFWNRLLWAGDQDGIRGGAYPVPEIEDIGQASMLPMDERPDVVAGKIPPAPGSFQMAMGASNQGITQILKTMSHLSHKKYDQWSMRPTLRPFFSVDYERDATDPRGAAAPFNMPHKNFALKSMADRAISSLRSGDLSPYHPSKNPGGIKYSQIETNLMLWSGEYDNMMARNQRLRYKYWMPKSRVLTQLVPRAGHFSGLDQPIWIATMIIEFHTFLFPPGKVNSLPKVFLGFDGIFKGNEEKEAAAYQKLY